MSSCKCCSSDKLDFTTKEVNSILNDGVINVSLRYRDGYWDPIEKLTLMDAVEKVPESYRSPLRVIQFINEEDKAEVWIWRGTEVETQWTDANYWSKVLDSNTVIDTSFIKDGSITTAKLAEAAVTNEKLGADAISTEKVQDEAIVTDKLAAKSVTEPKISDELVDKVNNNVKFVAQSLVISAQEQAQKNLGLMDNRGNVFATPADFRDALSQGSPSKCYFGPGCNGIRVRSNSSQYNYFSGGCTSITIGEDEASPVNNTYFGPGCTGINLEGSCHQNIFEATCKNIILQKNIRRCFFAPGSKGFTVLNPGGTTRYGIMFIGINGGNTLEIDLSSAKFANTANKPMIISSSKGGTSVVSTLEDLRVTFVGDEVSYLAQDRTDAEKSQARANIGALSSEAGAVLEANIADGAVTKTKIATGARNPYIITWFPNEGTGTMDDDCYNAIKNASSTMALPDAVVSYNNNNNNIFRRTLYDSGELKTVDFGNGDSYLRLAFETDGSRVYKCYTKASDNNFLLRRGGAMTGALTVLEPTADMNPATKKYVDDKAVNTFSLDLERLASTYYLASYPLVRWDITRNGEAVTSVLSTLTNYSSSPRISEYQGMSVDGQYVFYYKCLANPGAKPSVTCSLTEIQQVVSTEEIQAIFDSSLESSGSIS